MSQTALNSRTFNAGGTIRQYRMVRLDPADCNNVVEASTDQGAQVIGISLNAASSGEPVAVDLKSTGKTAKLACASGFSGTFSGAIDIYAGLSGYGSEGDAAAGTSIAYAIEDATAAGGIVEILWK